MKQYGFVSYKGNMPQIVSKIRQQLLAQDKFKDKFMAQINEPEGVKKLRKFETEVVR